MKYLLQDLIDMDLFQNLQDRLNEIYSFPSAIIDNDGNVLTATAWQDVCTQFHRKNAECERECIKSDQYILSHLHEANPAVSYRCPQGLVDNATPIIIDGIHYGNFFTGQFFLEAPDMEFFAAQARKYGFDDEAYLNAVKKVPIWSQEQLNNYLYFIKGLITLISESGLKRLREIETKQQIEDSENRAKTMLNQMFDGFWVTEPDAGRVVDVNDMMCRMLGYSREEMLQMSVADFEVNDSPEMIARRIQQIMGNGSAQFESRFRRKDGAIIDIDVRIAFLPEHKLFFAFHRDISERKRLEEERLSLEERLHRAEKMEALGTLAGGVAHDLNNVLGILTGYSEMLLEMTPSGSKMRNYVENIMKSSERGAAIIDDLLTLARRGVSVAKPLNLNLLTSSFLQTPAFEKLKKAHPWVAFKVELDPALMNIKGSPVHLEKALMNLVYNAAEATTGSGLVAVKTGNLHLDRPVRGYDEIREGDYAVLTVSDTGCGIPANDLKKIFEPFYTKKIMGKSGTGLGLSVVWGTVKDHQGYIDVLSTEGQGSSFTLYFPATRENLPEDQNRKMPLEQYLGHGETILVVDDMEGQREVAGDILVKLGYRVHAVSGGEEALEYIKFNKPDLIILDMIMPGMDGLETYRRLLEINPRQKTILVSGFSSTDRVKEAQRLGAGAYIRKPYMMETIGLAVRDELSKRN